MKNSLSKLRLANYAVSGTDYYEKYREKFNQKGQFISWNGAAFLFLPIWLVYRKLWGPYFVLLCFNFLIAPISYALLISGPIQVSYLILAGVLFLVAGGYAIFVMLRANAMFLSDAKRNGIEDDDYTVVYNGKSKWHIVVIASVVFLLPNILLAYGSYQHIKEEQDKYNIYKLASLQSYDATPVLTAQRIIDDIASSNINNYGYRGGTALNNIVCLNNTDVLKQLVRKGAHLNSPALVKAIYCHADQSVKFLLDKQVTLDDDIYVKALCRVIYNEDLPMLKILLAQKDSFYTYKCDNDSLLESALRTRKEARMKLVTYLIEKGGEPYRQIYKQDIKALQTAIENNDLAVIKYLLGIGIKTSDEAMGGSIAFYAFDASPQVLKLLLDNNVDPNGQSRGKSLLEIAIIRNNVSNVTLLLNSGAKVTEQHVKRATAEGNQDIISLIKKSASLQAR